VEGGEDLRDVRREATDCIRHGFVALRTILVDLAEEVWLELSEEGTQLAGQDPVGGETSIDKEVGGSNKLVALRIRPCALALNNVGGLERTPLRAVPDEGLLPLLLHQSASVSSDASCRALSKSPLEEASEASVLRSESQLPLNPDHLLFAVVTDLRWAGLSWGKVKFMVPCLGGAKQLECSL